MAYDCAFQNLNADCSHSPGTASEIWVADDNPDVRLLLHRAFKRFFPPVPVEYFSDGAGIVERIRSGNRLPKLLLLDFQMPSLNGIETLKELNAAGATEQSVVLIFSTAGTAKDVEDAYRYGARFFLQKPVGGEQYRDVAKLCLKFLDLPVSGVPVVRTRSALSVAAALASVESREPAETMIF